MRYGLLVTLIVLLGCGDGADFTGVDAGQLGPTRQCATSFLEPSPTGDVCPFHGYLFTGYQWNAPEKPACASGPINPVEWIAEDGLVVVRIEGAWATWSRDLGDFDIRPWVGYVVAVAESATRANIVGWMRDDPAGSPESTSGYVTLHRSQGAQPIVERVSVDFSFDDGPFDLSICGRARWLRDAVRTGAPLRPPLPDLSTALSTATSWVPR